MGATFPRYPRADFFSTGFTHRDARRTFMSVSRTQALSLHRDRNHSKAFAPLFFSALFRHFSLLGWCRFRLPTSVLVCMLACACVCACAVW